MLHTFCFFLKYQKSEKSISVAFDLSINISGWVSCFTHRDKIKMMIINSLRNFEFVSYQHSFLGGKFVPKERKKCDDWCCGFEMKYWNEAKLYGSSGILHSFLQPGESTIVMQHCLMTAFPRNYYICALLHMQLVQ